MEEQKQMKIWSGSSHAKYGEYAESLMPIMVELVWYYAQDGRLIKVLCQGW